MKLQPTANFVILRDTKKKDEVTDGGIVLPQGSQEKEHSEAEILAIGPLVNRMTEEEKKVPIIKVGSTAIYESEATIPMSIGDQKYRIIGASRIYAVIDQE